MQDDDAINARIARRVRELRAAGELSMEALATRCGVSRSMISLVERGETSATAVVLERLATGLGVPLAALFDAPAPAASPLARAADQPMWRDPASGYRRRNVSPPGAGAGVQIVEVEMPAGARVAYDTGPREPRVHQQVWVLEGRLVLRTGEAEHTLDAGDCLAMTLDAPTAFHNPTRQTTRYAVVLHSEALPRSPR